MLVVPNPEYVISQKGKLILIHNNFKYIAREADDRKGHDKKIRWRCSYKYKSRYACTAKAFTCVIGGVEQAQFTGYHSHQAPLNIKCKSSPK